MDNIEFTIIIPCYNAENTIVNTLVSLEEQTYKNFKVYLIDDGSSDSTVQVVESYMLKSNLNLQIFKESNQGVSSARNYGLQLCDTKYVLFLDADDRYNNRFIEYISYYQDKYKMDTVASRYYFTNSTDSIFNDSKVKEIGLKTKWELLQLYTHKRTENISFCNFCYKVSILKKYNITFDKSIKYGEDTLFLCKYLKHCNNGGVFIDKPLYAYYQNEASATHNVSYRITDNIIACDKSVRYWKNDPLYQEDWGKYFVARAVWAAAKTFGEFNHKFYLKFIKTNDIKQDMQIMSKFGDERTIRISSKIYLFSPLLFEVCMRIAKRRYQD